MAPQSSETPKPPPPRAAAFSFDSPPGLVRTAFAAMGTRFELVLHGLDEPRLRAAAEDAQEEVQLWHDRLSAFDPGSVLARLAGAAPHAIPVAGDIMNLLLLCRAVWQGSDGTFDPTLAPILRAWGLRGDADTPPAPDLLDSCRPLVGMALLELDEARGSARLAKPGMALDLGAVAKGWALDEAAGRLRDAGVPRAFVHGGTSSILAIGAPPGRDAWEVVVAPPPGSQAPPLRVRLADRSLSVSAPHGRQVDLSGHAITHILDPRTLRPTAAAQTAAVWGPSGALCDAWSTACIVLGGRPPGLPDDYASAVLVRGEWQIDPPAAAVCAPPGQDSAPPAT